jgi:spermidine/putrescine transport system substrate-binding protein
VHVDSKFYKFYFYGLRIVIILFCLLLIFSFLYAPYLNQNRKSQTYITICTWSDMFDLGSIAIFEQQTGIKVNFVYYDNCDELITKLQINKGHGYDLLFLADCNLRDLIQMDLLAKIDYNSLDFVDQIDQRFLNQFYDPQNIYSLPYSWDIYGIGINLAKFNYQMPPNSWALIFGKNDLAVKIGMMEDGLSVFNIAAQYLYQNNLVLDLSQIFQIKNLLLKQKKIVEVYTTLRSDYLLSSGTCSAVVNQAACVYRAMQKNSQIKFLVPQEGGFISTENFAVLKASTKQDLVYKFMNFIYQKPIVSQYIGKTKFLPSRRDVLHEINLDYFGDSSKLVLEHNFTQDAFFRYLLPCQQISKLWVEVKAS